MSWWLVSRHSNFDRGEGRHSVAHLKDGGRMSPLPNMNIIAGHDISLLSLNHEGAKALNFMVKILYVFVSWW